MYPIAISKYELKLYKIHMTKSSSDVLYFVLCQKVKYDMIFRSADLLHHE